ncbi:ATP-binding protein [Bythopirellula goksoeyrii]|uniref:AAA-like domain protein n=1 Tax=Bythopirellula goksoeyrii TaxID=1400387 RepID=A0A5B9QD37_9BACT|nr:ATP-binding protein [Bythopirellula goksoeyrii]QEG36804.1 AAA-like domain protein [Bythopirellula goksoeyrii]
MQDYEKRGSFYLGRDYDLAQRKVAGEKVLYDSSDLTTHAVCVGMTGSGKTGLCLSLIEEAALDGIPVIAVDPKGDLGNLLLAFPDLLPADFQPWVDPAVAVQKGMTEPELAEQTATLWRKGLAEWDESGERIQRFNDAVDKVIYTPGSSAGIPLSILKGFHAPPQEVIDDTDIYQDLVQSTTQGVFALLGLEADPVKSREAILVSNVLDHAWRAGRSPDLAGLIHDIQQPPFTKVGIVDLETFLPAPARLELGMKLNNLLASPSFASWLEGSALDINQLLYTDEKKPRLSILSIAHLNDSERMFFVTILLNEIVAWMRSQPGTGSLRAILYMDEVFGYFPPTANPPSKKPMLTLLKQARAYGLGVVLATQNPVDLDYKGLSNAGTWFLGRLQTERDKMRVLEGLEGASTQAGATFNRQQMEATLAALGSRVFLMNNVHENQPRVFHTRWAMSYLRGPLTRDQIRTLMQPRRAEFAHEASAESDAKAELTNGGSQINTRPVLSGSIVQKYWPFGEELAEDCRLQYRPGIASDVKLHFVKSSAGVDFWRKAVALQTVDDKLPGPMWNTAMLLENTRMLEDAPPHECEFAVLPSPLTQEKNYTRWDNDLVDHLYRTERLTTWRCELLDLSSHAGESEAEFRARLGELALRKRSELVEDTKSDYANKINRAEAAVRKAEDYLNSQRSQFWMRLLEMLLVVGDALMGILGKKRSSRRQPTTAVERTMRERGQQSRAEEQLDEKVEALDRLKDDLQSRIEQIERECDPANLKLENEVITPRKSDIDVGPVVLVWLPWKIDDAGQAEPAW